MCTFLNLSPSPSKGLCRALVTGYTVITSLWLHWVHLNADLLDALLTLMDDLGVFSWLLNENISFIYNIAIPIVI